MSTGTGSEKERAAPRANTRARKKEAPPCFTPPIALTRQLGTELELRSLSLTYCDGRPNPGALDALSVLARSRHVERPSLQALRSYERLPLDKGPASKRRDPAFVAPEIMRLHEGLVERLQKVAERFPGRALEIVSGHRPDARDTSRHHHGRALDFRVQGISRERLRDFLRSFEATGVGYYPNSSFVHMDVREDKGYWVDRSGPGEAADYGVWPPPKREIASAQQRILQGALAELAALGSPVGARVAARDHDLETRGPTPVQRMAARVTDSPLTRAPRSLVTKKAEVREEPAHESGDQLTPAEVAHIRAQALKALEGLR